MMAADTVPATVPGPPDPPDRTATSGQPARGFLAAMVAPVQPARPTFDLTPTLGDPAHPGGPSGAPDGPLDRSAPGVSSASFRDTADQAARGSDPAGSRHKRSVWKEMWLAAATRWAKGGGTANKRLDLAKAKAQARAYQVKENRTTSVMNSGGLPGRNSGGSGSGTDKGTGKGGGNSGRSGTGPVNGSGNRSNGAGRGGPGGGTGGGRAGGRGAGGGAGNGTGGSGTRKQKDTGPSGKAGTGPNGTGNGRGQGAGKDAAGGRKTDTHGPAGKPSGTGPGSAGGAGKPGAGGKSGKDGAPGKAGTGTDSKGVPGKPDLTKTPKNGKDTAPKGAPGAGGTGGPSATGQKNGTTKAPGQPHPAPDKSPLQKSRETGHGDGTKARRAVDHVKAYMDGTRDGWADEKTTNAKEHQRLDKAHGTHQTKTGPRVVIVTDEGDDGVSTDVKPLLVKDIDLSTLTLGTDGARTSVSRKELRNFKQYEGKLEAKQATLQKIAEACKQLQQEAEDEAKACQDLAEQAKGVKGGDKLVTTLTKLADAARNQAAEADQLAKTAQRAAEMCKVVLTNIQTRYAPLFKAVVDSDETKPGEMRFYNDKGVYATAA